MQVNPILLAAIVLPTALLWCLWWKPGCTYATDPIATKALMDELTARVRALIKALALKYPADARTLALTRWQTHGAMRALACPSPAHVAFTMDKSRLFICTHDPVTGLANNVNAAMHVLLHELAHVITEQLHHPVIFWQNADFLMREAQAAGLYEPVQPNTPFCGRQLQSLT